MKKLLTIGILSTLIFSCSSEETVTSTNSDINKTPSSSGESLEDFIDSMTGSNFPKGFPKYSSVSSDGNVSIDSSITKYVIPYFIEEHRYNINNTKTYEQYKKEVQDYITKNNGKCEVFADSNNIHPNTKDRIKCKYNDTTKFTLEQSQDGTKIIVSMLLVDDEKTWNNNTITEEEFKSFPVLNDQYVSLMYRPNNLQDSMAITFFTEDSVEKTESNKEEDIPAIKNILSKLTTDGYTCTLVHDSDKIRHKYDYICDKNNKEELLSFSVFTSPSSLYGYYVTALYKTNKK